VWGREDTDLSSSTKRWPSPPRKTAARPANTAVTLSSAAASFLFVAPAAPSTATRGPSAPPERHPAYLLASPSELLASPNELLAASPSELLASPSNLLASPGALLAPTAAAAAAGSARRQPHQRSVCGGVVLHPLDAPGQRRGGERALRRRGQVDARQLRARRRKHHTRRVGSCAWDHYTQLVLGTPCVHLTALSLGCAHGPTPPGRPMSRETRNEFPTESPTRTLTSIQRDGCMRRLKVDLCTRQ
jgi:hypothetical protein